MLLYCMGAEHLNRHFECAGHPMFTLMATLRLTLKLSSVEVGELNVIAVEIRGLLLGVMRRVVGRAFMFLVQS